MANAIMYCRFIAVLCFITIVTGFRNNVIVQRGFLKSSSHFGGSLNRISNRVNHKDLIASSVNSIAVDAAAVTPTNRFSRALVKIISRIVHVNPVILGGMLSGGLHAITGPDHLAALIPPSIGKPGLNGVRIGALWGLGHGCSAMLLGLFAFFLKGQFTGRFSILEKLTSFAEVTVGFSLIAIGLLGIKENLDVEEFDAALAKGQEETATASATTQSSRAIIANGLLHGFSWDGAPSLAPAIAMSSWRSAVSFLLSYSIGTMLTMSITAGALAEMSIRIGKMADDPDLPRKLSFGSSFFAIAIGVYWIVQSLVSG